jgi:hypothetical protein
MRIQTSPSLSHPRLVSRQHGPADIHRLCHHLCVLSVVRPGWTDKADAQRTAEDPKKWKDMVKVDYKSKNWEETDVEVKITHCGYVSLLLCVVFARRRSRSVCGSDVHTLDHGWGKLAPPVVAGHEIVGIATRVGSQVDTGIKVGDRVGVGAQIASCYTCKLCTNQNENYCAKKIDTYVRAVSIVHPRFPLSFLSLLWSGLLSSFTFVLRPRSLPPTSCSDTTDRPTTTPTASRPRAATRPGLSPTSSTSSRSRIRSRPRRPRPCSVPASPPTRPSSATAPAPARRSPSSASAGSYVLLRLSSRTR